MVMRAVGVLLGLPVALALVEAVSFEVRNRPNGTLVSSGEEREYLLHVPTSYDPAKPTALVISMHGGAGWPAMQREVSRLEHPLRESGVHRRLSVGDRAAEGPGPGT